MHKNLTVINHPLINVKLGILRNKETPTWNYRLTMQDVARLMAYPLFLNLKTEMHNIETPLHEEMRVPYYAGYAPCLVSILRAGNGFLDGLIDMIPRASVGFVGMERDHETAEPIAYYCKLPSDMSQRQVYVVDPMLATGGSAIDSITKLKEEGAKDITFMCLVAAPEGVEALNKAHPDVNIITAALDRELNGNKYICPGLGDAGDRYYGT